MPIPDHISTALRVIDEAARRAETGPIERTEAIWDALKTLAEVKPSPVYRMFWKEIREPLRDRGGSHDFGRRQTINHAVARMYFLHGVKRPD